MTAAESIQVNIGKDLGMAIIGGITVEVSPESDVIVYTNTGVQTRPKAPVTALTKEGVADMHVSISKDFNAVALYGVRIELGSDSNLIVYTDGTVKIKPAPANDAAPKAELQIGDRMPAGHPNAGWIYAGISKTTHGPLYVAPKDSGVFKWKEAMAFAAKEDSRTPSREELDQIYEARNKGALKGTFNETGSYPAGWYWSSRDNGNYAWAQRFSDGYQSNFSKGYYSSLRCVR